MQYFDHSTDAASDPKIMALRLECGGSAVDAYWFLIERIHRDEKPICLTDASAMRVYCHALCTDLDMLEKWCEHMISVGLLATANDGTELVSERAASNIEKYHAKRESARSSAKSRWSNADAKPPNKRTQSKGNANKTKQNKTKGSNASKDCITNPSASDGAVAVEKTAPSAARKPVCPQCRVMITPNSNGAF
ncbi:MAG: DUF4373 domain-containing protein, partial [Raoultibacter sp.]